MREAQSGGRRRARVDRGFAVVQSTIALGLLGSGVYGMTAIGRAAIGEAQRVACATDRRVVQTAVETYRILENTATIPATGSGPDRYELTIVAAGFLTEQSELHDVTVDGWVVPADGRC
jgi:hypothetical protein